MTRKWVQDCILCLGSGIDIDNSDPGSGPTEYSMGEPPYWEPCICQFDPPLASRAERCPECRGDGECWRCDAEETSWYWW
jgi:hypothetical protein